MTKIENKLYTAISEQTVAFICEDKVDYPKLMSPKMDFVFKNIFGIEENKEYLIAFLNAILQLPHPIQDLTYLNTEMHKKHSQDKNPRLDVLAKFDDTHVVNIEIQLQDEDNIEPRMLYYWSNLFSDGLLAGQDYSELKKTISITILNFNFDDHEEYHSEWVIKNRYNERVMPHFEAHIMN